MGRNKLTLGSKARKKLKHVRRKLDGKISKSERDDLRGALRAYQKYKQQLVKAAKDI